MIPMSLKEIYEACSGVLFSEKNPKINDITTDSRLAKKGSLFAALAGERTDGHRFIASAVKNGAVAVLCEKKPEISEVPYILTDSVLKALQDIAAYILEKSNIPVVGIGGSVGKTSTKEAISSVLAQKYKVLKTEGNFNNELGLPLTVFKIDPSDEIAVLEMGICDFNEMSVLASIARPDICVLTNIGDCHLENLKDRNGVFKAKTEMFDYMKDGGRAVLNGDDDYLSKVKELRGSKPVFFGLKDTNDIFADNIIIDGIKGTYFDLHTPIGSSNVYIPKPGEHMVYNALAAAAVGLLMGFSLEEISRGIEEQTSVEGRFNIIEGNGLTIIEDCYNANPMSMKESLYALSKAAPRRVAVLGDMGELGKNAAELHAQVGKHISELDIELLVCIGELSENIAFEAKKNKKIEIACLKDIDLFLDCMKGIVKKGDTVLVKASHFMHFEKIVEALRSL